MNPDTTWPADRTDTATGVEPIAVIGASCRLPGAGDLAAYWRNLVDGTESISQSTLDDQARLGVPDQDLRHPDFVPAFSVLDDAEGFDAAFFGMSAREAQVRDPQHRLFLELAYTALENGGYIPDTYQGDIGVYAGAGQDVYQWLNTRRRHGGPAGLTSLEISVGSHPDYIATLASYKLNLRGPSFTLHTACSSSLVAIHVASEALRNGECDMALAGGVNIELPLGVGYFYSEGGILSADGHCRAFDAKASGTVGASGGAAVLLKRLTDAVADGDHVRCLVLGNAINNDGAQKGGFAAPSQEGQAEVIAQALAHAGVNPRSVSYVEAHGTATLLGDPIEVAALSAAYQATSPDKGWCAIGSVKSSIGHLGPASGAAGFVKTMLALEHRLIPPSINCDVPNPKIGFDQSPFYVNTTLAKWDDHDGPRRAGVSSFGIGGTNAHVVLQEAPGTPARSADEEDVQLLMLSARSADSAQAALRRLTAHLSELESAPEPPALADIAYTLRVGRLQFEHRLAVTATSLADAVAALTDTRRRITGAASREPPRVALMFPGQGAQYPGMGAGLYRTEPRFASAFDDCCDLLEPQLGADPRALIFDPGEAAAERLRHTALAQPALFAVEYALARLWEALGLRSSAMIGHSIGEYVAATLAGVFSLPDAVHVVCQRGRLMGELPAGAMLAVQLDEADALAELPDGLSIAAVNGRNTCVVAGPASLVERFAGELKTADVGNRLLVTSHAFHSAMMDPALAAFQDVVAGVRLSPPDRPVISNVTGNWLTPVDACDPGYWTRHLRQTVRFGDGLRTLFGGGDWLLLECGPGRQLCGLARMQPGHPPARPSMPSRAAEAAERDVLYAAAGRLWASGVSLDQDALGAPARRVPLPTYPWERKRYWIDADPRDDTLVTSPAGSGTPVPFEQWFAVPVWRQLPPVAAASRIDRCLLLGDGAAEPVAELLRAAGAQVIRVRSGQSLRRVHDGEYQLSPGSRQDYDGLVADLIASGGIPEAVVHGWALDGSAAASPHEIWHSQDHGFFSVLGLVQALAATQLGGEIRLTVLTSGTEDVSGADLCRPEHASVGGIVEVGPAELPWLRARQIDIGPQGDPGSAGTSAREWQAVLAELTADTTERTVALRSGRRWVRQFVPAPAPPEAAQPWPSQDALARPAGPGLRQGGVYLITGGTGGIGITLAEHLASQVGASIALVSRAGLPAREDWDDYPLSHGRADRVGRAIAAIRRMEERGSQVVVLSADVADEPAMRAVRETVLSKFGRLDGIIHAAGTPGGGVAEVKERSAAADVMRPKLLGTAVLGQVFGDLPLDFFALCSSVTAIAGGFGQVDYCAANKFLDAYARVATGWRYPVVSLNWGKWLDVGMAAEVTAPSSFRALQQGDTVSRMSHPVLTARHLGSAGRPGWCGGVISPDTHWVLGDHRIGGTPVLPGTAYLELAHAAATAGADPDTGGPDTGSDGHVIELRDVVFIEPLAVADGTSADIQVVLEPAAEGFEFKVVSKIAGTVRTHAQGHVLRVRAQPPPPCDLEALRSRCSLAVREGGHTAISRSGIISFGPHWGNVSSVRIGADEELAIIRPNETAARDLGSWVLHPALLDEATAVADTPDGQFIPLGYGRVTVYAPLAGRMYSHVTINQAGTRDITAADIVIYSGAGEPLVSIADFTMRRFDARALIAGIAPGTAAAASAAAGGQAGLAGISPAAGAQAFALVGAGQLGSQVVVSATPIDELIRAGRRLTKDSIETGTDFTPQATQERARNSADYVAPRTELESAIARIWRDVLGAEQIGLTDDFFELGGNSLIAVQVISVVRKEVGARLPMRSLFDNPTVAGAAAAIEKLRAAGSTPPGDEEQAAACGQADH